MQKKLFLKNTLILTATALILRSVGIFFRIYLSNTIGAEGMGIYQLIFSVYALMGVLASAGFNVSVTKLVSAKSGEDRKIMSLCFKLSLFKLFNKLKLCRRKTAVLRLEFSNRFYH